MTTDEKGKFFIFGTFHLFPRSPRILIYKRGYIAWNVEYLFPDFKRRTEQTGPIKLQKFEVKYPAIEPKHTYYDHMYFIDFLILDTGPLMNKALEWERGKALQEHKYTH